MDVLGSFSLESKARAVKVEGLLTGPALPTAGYGGWNKVQRPRRRSLTDWNGRDALSLSIPFVFDKSSTNESVEPEFKGLELLGGVGLGDRQPPSDVNVASSPSALIAHALDHVDWFVESIDWDADSIIAREDTGEKIRAGGTLIITQYVADDYLQKLPVPTRRKSSKKSKTKVYVVKAGDTLSKIAAKQLKNAKRWKEIAKLNGIRDPKKLKVGQKIKLP